MSVTKKIAKYIKDMGINLSELSRKSGVPYHSLYDSLADEKRGRELRANELTDVCFVLKINPMDFADDPEQKDKKPTFNDIHKEHGLGPVEGGDVKCK